MAAAQLKVTRDNKTKIESHFIAQNAAGRKPEKIRWWWWWWASLTAPSIMTLLLT